MSLTPYNSTQPADAAAVQSYGNAVAWAMMMSYFIALTWIAANWGNHPGARAWTTIGQITDLRSGVSYQAIRDAIGEIVAPLPVRPKATGWQRVGNIAFSPGDVNPPILQTSPVYMRTYASGKRSWRYWDDITEEWIYSSAPPMNLAPVFPKDSPWVKTAGIVNTTGYDGEPYRASLYQRTNESGTEEYRFQNQFGHWIYPSERDLTYVLTS